ncbi:MAG: WD40 repeat domain-containing protein, partial [Roseimicrobium sp.]
EPHKHSAAVKLTGMSTAALQPQGHRLLLGMASGQAQLRDIDSGEFVGKPLPHRGAVTAAAFVTDGGIAVTGDADGVLYGWNCTSGQPTGETVRMEGAVIFCQATPHHGRVVAVSANGEFRLWEPAAESVTVHRTRKPLRAVAMSRCGTLVALSHRDAPGIQVWEMHGRMIEPRYLAASQKPPLEMTKMRQPSPTALTKGAVFCWDATGERSASAEADGTLRIGQSIVLTVKAKPPVTTIALSSDARYLATAGKDRNAQLWHLKGTQATAVELQHNAPVPHIAFTPDSQRIVTATSEGELRCWDVATGEPLMPSTNRGDRIKSLCIAANGRAVCYERRSGGWFTFPIPPLGERQPAWFLQTAEVRRRLSENGSSAAVSNAEARAAFNAIPTNYGHLAQQQLAKWIISDPSRRPLWPDDEGSFSDYLEELIRTKEPAALREVLRFDPLNDAAAAALRVSP